MCFTHVTAKAPIEKGLECKDPMIHVQVPLSMVQPIVQYQNQGYHPGMPLAYPTAWSSTVVAPQYVNTGASYVLFGVRYGQTSNQIINIGLVHSAHMFPPMATPQIHS